MDAKSRKGKAISGTDSLETTSTLDAEITMERSPDGAQRNPGIGTEATAVFPGMRCAPSGLHTVWVSRNWRVTFKFVGKDADAVDYEDYH
jgi:hypothetical protein